MKTSSRQAPPRITTLRRKQRGCTGPIAAVTNQPTITILHSPTPPPTLLPIATPSLLPRHRPTRPPTPPPPLLPSHLPTIPRTHLPPPPLLDALPILPTLPHQRRLRATASQSPLAGTA